MNIKNIQPFLLALMAAVFVQCNTQTNNKANMKAQSVNSEIVVDVRSREEWNFDGHSNCAVNVPLDEFDAKIIELLNYDKIIIVCRSGARADVARAKLISAGYTKPIENLGPWQNVVCKN